MIELKINKIIEKPRLLLSVWCLFLMLVYQIYRDFGVRDELAIISIFIILCSGYVVWAILFTSDGQYFYDKYLFNIIDLVSFPRKYRIKVLIVSFIVGACLSVITLINNTHPINITKLIIVFCCGLFIGLITIFRIQNHSLNRYRKNFTISFNIIKLIFPMLFLPILFNNNNNIVWGCFTIGYYCTYFFYELLILNRHYTINYFLSLISVSESENELDDNNFCSFDDNKHKDPYKFNTVEVFCNFNKYGYKFIAKGIIKDLVSYSKKEDPLLLPAPILRDRFRLWYSERLYHRIIKYGERYLSQFVERNDFSDLSSVVLIIYIKSLIRTGLIEEATRKLYADYGKSLCDTFLCVERALFNWNNGDTERAISDIRFVLNKMPTFSVAKNCLSFYLCDTAIDYRYKYEITFDDSFYKEYVKRKQEAGSIIDSISETSLLIDVNSYYWSNKGFYNLVGDNFDDAYHCFEKSIKLILSKENVRSRLYLGALNLCVNRQFDEAIYHLQRATLDVSRNNSSRYFKVSNSLINLIEKFVQAGVYPNEKFLFCINPIYSNYLYLEKSNYDLEYIFKISPKSRFFV